MSTVVVALIWALMGGLVVAAGVRLRRRLRAVRDEGRPRLDDEALRQILETGRFVSEEDPPLDLEEIEEAEERFWSEPWDEPEP